MGDSLLVLIYLVKKSLHSSGFIAKSIIKKSATLLFQLDNSVPLKLQRNINV